MAVIAQAYALQADPTGLTFFKLAATTWTPIGARFGNLVITAGSRIFATAEGDKLSAWHQPAGGTMTYVGTVTDGTYTEAGSVGVALLDGSVRVDDFASSTLTPLALPEILSVVAEPYGGPPLHSGAPGPGFRVKWTVAGFRVGDTYEVDRKGVITQMADPFLDQTGADIRAGETYTYRVRGGKPNDWGAWSPEITVAPVPYPPQNLRVTGRTATTVSVAVDPNADLRAGDKYQWYRNDQLVAETAASAYTFTGLTPGLGSPARASVGQAGIPPAGGRSARTAPITITPENAVVLRPFVDLRDDFSQGGSPDTVRWARRGGSPILDGEQLYLDGGDFIESTWEFNAVGFAPAVALAAPAAGVNASTVIAIATHLTDTRHEFRIDGDGRLRFRRVVGGVSQEVAPPLDYSGPRMSHFRVRPRVDGVTVDFQVRPPEGEWMTIAADTASRVDYNKTPTFLRVAVEGATTAAARFGSVGEFAVTARPTVLDVAFPATDTIRLTIAERAEAEYVVERSATFDFADPQHADDGTQPIVDLDAGELDIGTHYFRVRYREGGEIGPPSGIREVLVRAHATDPARNVAYIDYVRQLSGLRQLLEPDPVLDGRILDLSPFEHHAVATAGVSTFTSLDGRAGMRFNGAGAVAVPSSTHLDLDDSFTLGFLLTRRRQGPQRECLGRMQADVGGDAQPWLFAGDLQLHQLSGVGHARTERAIPVRPVGDDTLTLVALDSDGNLYVDGIRDTVVITNPETFVTGLRSGMLWGAYRDPVTGRIENHFQGDLVLPFLLDQVMAPLEHADLFGALDGATLGGDNILDPYTISLFAGPPDVDDDATPTISGRIEGPLNTAAETVVRIAVDGRAATEVVVPPSSREFSYTFPELPADPHSLVLSVEERTTLPPLAAPVLLTPAIRNGRLIVQGGAVADADAYDWRRGTGVTPPAALDAHPSQPTTTPPTLDDTGLANGTRHWYQMRARSEDGRVSSWSNMVSGTPSATPPPQPALRSPNVPRPLLEQYLRPGAAWLARVDGDDVVLQDAATTAAKAGRLRALGDSYGYRVQQHGDSVALYLCRENADGTGHVYGSDRNLLDDRVPFMRPTGASGTSAWTSTARGFWHGMSGRGWPIPPWAKGSPALGNPATAGRARQAWIGIDPLTEHFPYAEAGSSAFLSWLTGYDDAQSGYVYDLRDSFGFFRNRTDKGNEPGKEMLWWGSTMARVLIAQGVVTNHEITQAVAAFDEGRHDDAYIPHAIAVALGEHHPSGYVWPGAGTEFVGDGLLPVTVCAHGHRYVDQRRDPWDGVHGCDALYARPSDELSSIRSGELWRISPAVDILAVRHSTDAGKQLAAVGNVTKLMHIFLRTAQRHGMVNVDSTRAGFAPLGETLWNPANGTLWTDRMFDYGPGGAMATGTAWLSELVNAATNDGWWEFVLTGPANEADDWLNGDPAPGAWRPAGYVSPGMGS